MSGVAGVRKLVFLRDKGCVAPRLDRHAGMCYDRWGHARPEYARVLPFDEGEMDFCRLGATGDRHELPGDHVWVCPGHHRGAGPSAGYQWATAHRAQIRAWLDGTNKS